MYVAKPGLLMDTNVIELIKFNLAFTAAVSANQSSDEPNLIVSPYNALTCLSMIAKGAKGQTRAEMAEVLFNTSAQNLDYEIEKLARLNTWVLEGNADNVDLRTANAVWVNSLFATLDPQYKESLEKVFKAKVEALNFSNPNAVDQMNAWINEHTGGKIDGVIKQLDAQLDHSVLASAIYFKGDWSSKFDPELTVDKNFTADGGNIVATATMHQEYSSGQVKYNEGDGYQAASLTYGGSGRGRIMQAVLVRPSDPNVNAIEFLKRSAKSGTIPAWLDPLSYEKAQGVVELPHIDLKQSHQLIPSLQAMGIKDAFSGEADFSGMDAKQGKNILIGSISQEVVCKTDENGSENAAVTVASMTRGTSLAPPPRTIDLRLDRSFIKVTQDVGSGAPLFIEVVGQPSENMNPVVH